jgi:uncharacterized protein (DUF2126 family)/transglutaminase-like putative cysteine protease
MTLHVALTHRTEYRYDRPTGLGPQVIRLRPAPHCRTPILSYSLSIIPGTHFLNWQQDPFGNFLARMIATEKTREFSVTVDLIADLATINPFNFFITEEAEGWPFVYEPNLKEELLPYLTPLPAGPRLAAYLAGLRIDTANTLDFLCDLNRRLSHDISYLIRMEPGVQTPEETLGAASGSCRDSAWLLTQILRHYGLAARFVSGYLIQLKPDVKPLEGPAGASADFTDLHAWTEVYAPGAGWIGLDPTSGLLAGEGHIPLAATPSPSSAAPISGGHEPAEVEFSFHMEVTRIAETPRATKPYAEELWTEIFQAGQEVDRRLSAADARLTMGGEPTFVAADDPDGAEWNIAADGPTKRRYAEDLIRRLRRRFAPDGLLHYGQGKWYPGEPLPRWALSVYWRRDGEPLWLDETLVASCGEAEGATVEHARDFMGALSETLGLPRESAIPAYEDPAHLLLIEQGLPLNLDPDAARLEDAAERERLIRALERGITTPTAYILPIQPWQSRELGRRWMTERWMFRRRRLFLLPGDSPVGFRLPLGGLPYVAPEDFPHVFPVDPFAAHAATPAREVLLRDRRLATNQATRASDPELTAPIVPPLPFPNEVAGAVRTALSVEPRNGALCVFMPPLVDGDDYAALSAAIEEAARISGAKVHIEGYAPPYDPNLGVIKVTPDPGVIEVNIQPARNWKEAADITAALYEEARLCGLDAQKFMVDGRHTGTGGGNHIVLGGVTPADSPFLRRPDLLASLITFWQNHPSLSFLFSGLFIGPTSQAPRIDEARHDQLYELEIALRQIPDRAAADGAPIQPWLVDRLFRNLLIDVTGNTHRAEICIDKLYSPDGPTGRLGLVEFRSFEMPPHPQMSLAQQLLLRALIAWFWEKPYKQKLARWGTSLHDRFMLPRYVWADFRDVLAALRGAGFPLKEEWFEPHFEFRFPSYGSVEHNGVELSLRQALEPWHVLGEESAAGGVARYVDSSLERVEVTLRGATPGRHAAACNGVAIPLASTGVRGELAAGVRYRAWKPPSCLHPLIDVHTPLTFDIYDAWSGRSLGGCRYHATHPGGRGYDDFPVNALEAECRRRARFEETGHTPGPMTLTKPEANEDFPLTLDLRLFPEASYDRYTEKY